MAVFPGMSLPANVRTIHFEELKEILPTVVAYERHHRFGWIWLAGNGGKMLVSECNDIMMA